MDRNIQQFVILRSSGNYSDTGRAFRNFLCPACNSRVRIKHSYCGYCGQAIKFPSDEVICKSCDKKAKKGDKFCSGCGKELT